MIDLFLWLLSSLLGFLLAVATLLLFVRLRRKKTARVLETWVLSEDGAMRLGGIEARYCGADSGCPRGPNNGAVVIGERNLYYQHFLEKRPSLVVPLAGIRQVTLEPSFRGVARKSEDSDFLVIRTSDDNRLGFLLKDPQALRDMLQPG
ncbi:MAG: hypothetical protein P8X63_06800 [Desulfuromonadaceae bacterium]